MARSDSEDSRNPRRFDPQQRGRDFTRTRTRRKRGQTERTTERRIENLETWSFLNTSVATQAAATTLIEVVTTLPDPTYLDIGRQIILRSPAAVHDILYVGMQLPDDTVAWIQWTSIYEDSPNSPEFTWSANKSTGNQLRGVFHTSTYVVYARSTQVAKFTPPDDPATVVSSAIPFGSNPPYGIYAEDAGGFTLNVWVALQTLDKVQYENHSSGTVLSSAVRDYWGVAFDSVGNRLLFTDRANNRCLTANKTTLALIATFATDCLTPEGIAADSSGNIYIADTGNNRIRKYNSSLTHQLNWGGIGSADGQFNTPRGICVDGADRIYVADSANNRIQVFSNIGTFLGKFGIGGSGNSELSNPVGVSVNGTGIAVADAGNDRVSYWTRT